MLTLVRPEGLLAAKNRAHDGLKRRLTRKTLKKPKNEPHLRIRHPAAAADWCDVGRMTKDMPPDDSDAPPRQRMSFTQIPAITADECDTGRVTICMLPEDALLAIFGFYFKLDDSRAGELKASLMNFTLVHVCQKWRNVVFRSPHCLDLQLHCTPWTPVKRMLDVWPSLPIVVHHFGLTSSEWGMHNLITALGHKDRVCQIALKPIPGWQWGKFMTAMSHPFPALTHLRLTSDDERETPSVAPDSFLGGSTPRLRFLWLERIPFLGLPNLLSSATDLVDLRLWEIPHSGYISPEAMATALSALTRLERLDLEFESSRSRPDRESQRPPSSSTSTRFVLPSLTRWRECFFKDREASHRGNGGTRKG